jgi:hypothetical protein
LVNFVFLLLWVLAENQLNFIKLAEELFLLFFELFFISAAEIEFPGLFKDLFFVLSDERVVLFCVPQKLLTLLYFRLDLVDLRLL